MQLNNCSGFPTRNNGILNHEFLDRPVSTKLIILKPCCTAKIKSLARAEKSYLLVARKFTNKHMLLNYEVTVTNGHLIIQLDSIIVIS